MSDKMQEQAEDAEAPPVGTAKTDNRKRNAAIGVASGVAAVGIGVEAFGGDEPSIESDDADVRQDRPREADPGDPFEPGPVAARASGAVGGAVATRPPARTASAAAPHPFDPIVVAGGTSVETGDTTIVNNEVTIVAPPGFDTPDNDASNGDQTGGVDDGADDTSRDEARQEAIEAAKESAREKAEERAEARQEAIEAAKESAREKAEERAEARQEAIEAAKESAREKAEERAEARDNAVDDLSADMSQSSSVAPIDLDGPDGSSSDPDAADAEASDDGFHMIGNEGIDLETELSNSVVYGQAANEPNAPEPQPGLVGEDVVD